ncbi:extracellular domains-containing protein [Tropilaelaps mercedesae]|uniref:Extracellular domains-containing protein n=1 Tax=Tropilaelaps mercedesae TaxID=418985 RepID=A0A1V9XIQ4_9ACAR|nr:extracellular domains-containing protein [Tropilaelaps mercedesae]
MGRFGSALGPGLGSFLFTSSIMVSIIAFSLLRTPTGVSAQLSNNQNSGNFRESQQIYYPEIPNSYIGFRRMLMYPYNEGDRAPTDASKPEHEMSLTNRLPYFGFAYKYIKIHTNGFVHFGGGPKEYRLPLQFPLKPDDTVSEKDPAIIAAWLTYQVFDENIRESGLYARLVKIRKRSELVNCHSAIQDKNECWLQLRLHDDFNGGMIGSQGFAPTFALIVTWRNTTMPQTERRGQWQKTNTFQMVIASDEIRSYVMFNYEKIDWISSEDRKDGTNGLNPFIGFNAGNTTRAYEFFPYSQQPRVSQITEGGGEEMKGRYIFQINEEIYTGTCINWELDPHLIKQRPRLSFFPKYANMLGGTMINVTGPCFPERAKIECQFQDMSGGRFPAIYRDRHHASCYMPPVFYHGYVDLTVTVDGGDALFYGRFYIQPPQLANEDILIVDDADKQEKPRSMRLQWRVDKLSSIRDDTREIGIHLWGFADDKEYPSLTYITQLGTAGIQEREVNFDLSQFRNNNDRDKLNLQFGFISINLTNANLQNLDVDEKSPMIWSRPMPLSWYFWPQWEYQFGSYWKDAFCHDWFQHEREGDKFAITVWRCPCTLRQSELDRGRFAPDTLCNTYSRKCDPFYKTALQCVKSGRPSVGGSGQTCCYDPEGELILTADSMYGGKPQRYFSYGVLPYNQRSKVASLATWQADMMPFFTCCQWQSEKDDSNSCQKYKYFRTSQDCSAYQPPGFAAVFGDPHFLTFDGANYTFNGHGEFSLVRADNEKAKLNIQGRFESRRREHFSDVIVNGTYLSGVAARDNVSSTVEFHLRPLVARWQYQMYLIVDNEYIYFWDETMRTQNFKGVSIYQPTGYYNMSKIVAMFDSGAGVEASVINEQLVLHVFLPVEFVNITTGLLGSWDNSADNDLSPNQQGVGGISSQTDKEIYNEFGNKHRLNESASLFNHQLFGYNFGHYDDVHFQPFFATSRGIAAPSNATFRERDLEETCATSRACRFDYVVTGSKTYAATTKLVEASAQSIAAEVRRTEIRCQALDKPAHGLKSEIRNFVGKTVRFTCAQGYRLYGHEYRQCKETGLWSWGEDPSCKSIRAHTTAMVGITLGIIMPILLLLCCIYFCFCRRQRSHEEGESYFTKEAGEMKPFTEKPPQEEPSSAYQPPEQL